MNAVTLVQYESWEVDFFNKGLKKVEKEITQKVDKILTVVLTPFELDILMITDKDVIKSLIIKTLDSINW